MKIVIVSSLSFPDRIIEIQTKLESMGHSVFIPPTTHQYLSGQRQKGKLKEDLAAKGIISLRIGHRLEIYQ